jgi:hypothetical protein
VSSRGPKEREEAEVQPERTETPVGGGLFIVASHPFCVFQRRGEDDWRIVEIIHAAPLKNQKG